MRLRYLHLRGDHVLDDVRIVFGRETILNRACAIRFLVGVNGTGKSRLLRLLTETFLALDAGDAPPFGVTLAYDLWSEGEQPFTVYLAHHSAKSDGQDSASDSLPDKSDPYNLVFVAFTQELSEDPAIWDALGTHDWTGVDPFSYGNTAYPLRAGPYFDADVNVAGVPAVRFGSLGTTSRNTYLPSQLLVYTSGDKGVWRDIFAQHPDDTSIEDEALVVDIDHERPVGWTEKDEAQYQGRPPLPEEAGKNTFSIGSFLDNTSLKLALCAVALVQAKEDFGSTPDAGTKAAFIAEVVQRHIASNEGNRPPGLRGIFDSVGWVWPVTVGLHITFNRDLLARRNHPARPGLTALYKAATSVLRDPMPSEGRRLFFDLRRLVGEERESTLDQLIFALSGDIGTPAAIFATLYKWQQSGLLTDVTLGLRRDTGDVLLFEQLSDGERMFLARMGLFALFKGQRDALLLLDEPETHFNDVWKRQIVDIIDENLRSDPNDVLIATHSSIALTDVFESEITLLRKEVDSERVAWVETPISTFGTSPNEILRNVFGAPESVGQRAAEFLDIVLLATGYPVLLERIWGQSETTMFSDPAYQQLRDILARVPGMTEVTLDRRLHDALLGIRRYMRQNTSNPLTVFGVLQALQMRVGSGFYQFELRRRLRAIEGPEQNVASH